ELDRDGALDHPAPLGQRRDPVEVVAPVAPDEPERGRSLLAEREPDRSPLGRDGGVVQPDDQIAEWIYPPERGQSLGSRERRGGGREHARQLADQRRSGSGEAVE